MKRFVTLLVGIIIVVGAALGVVHRQYLWDQFISRTHTLEPRAAAVARKLALTDRGMLLFRASRSEIQNAEAFNRSCQGVHKELTVVLGCYARQRIFVFHVTDNRLAGAVEVTVAHELLHAAYERLSSSERRRVDGLLRVAAETLPEGRTKETVEQYRQAVPEHLPAELYAILGTEYADLAPELEAHYSQYFTDRRKIVNYATQYESVFTQLEREIESYDTQLAQLASQKTDIEADLADLRTSLQTSEANLRRLRGQDEVAAYNRAVPQHNALVASYNQAVGRLKSIVEQYNDIVGKRNKLAITQNGLARTLDSKYEPIQQ